MNNVEVDVDALEATAAPADCMPAPATDEIIALGARISHLADEVSTGRVQIANAMDDMMNASTDSNANIDRRLSLIEQYLSMLVDRPVHGVIPRRAHGQPTSR